MKVLRGSTQTSMCRHGEAERCNDVKMESRKANEEAEDGEIAQLAQDMARKKAAIL